MVFEGRDAVQVALAPQHPRAQGKNRLFLLCTASAAAAGTSSGKRGSTTRAVTKESLTQKGPPFAFASVSIVDA